MYVDIEVISNNTYTNNLFTYKVPNNVTDKISIGSIVSVPFRNKDYKGIVLSLTDKTDILNVKEINKYLGITLNGKHLDYLKQLAISNKLNIGIILYNLFDISNYKNQKVMTNKRIKNIPFANLKNIDTNRNNVFFVPSLKVAKNLNNQLSKITNIDFYQKFGGKDEITNILSKKFKNIILLNTNFEKINLEQNTNYYFYDSNHPAWRLPKLNNLNITEAAHLKQNIFGGSFIFINEFPNLEFYNQPFDYKEEHNYELEYFIENSVENCINLYSYKYPDKVLHVYSNSPLNQTDIFTYADKVTDTKIEAILLINPTLVTNNIINSYKVIYLLSILNHAKNYNLKTIIFSTNEININKVLNSKSINKWIKKEQETRSKYGPSLLNKIFTFISKKPLKEINNNFVKGPIEMDDGYLYEINIDLQKSYDYLEIMNMYKDLKNYDLNRARFI